MASGDDPLKQYIQQQCTAQGFSIGNGDSGHATASSLDTIRQYSEYRPDTFTNFWSPPIWDSIGGNPFAAPETYPESEEMYPYVLRFEDEDQKKQWDGQQRSEANGDTVPPPYFLGYVQQLQNALKEFGFTFVSNDDEGVFGWNTYFAVREFQIYSGMLYLAQAPATLNEEIHPLSTQYTQVKNTQVYNGPVSGVADFETQRKIVQWGWNRWRCPVTIEAWSMESGKRNALYKIDNDNWAENLWGAKDFANNNPRMFAHDFTGYYTVPNQYHVPHKNDASTQPETGKGVYVTIGEYVPFTDHNNITWGGPVSKLKHSWEAEMKMTSERLFGKPLPDPSASENSPAPQNVATEEEQSTYKVIDKICELEAGNVFDSMNAYDSAILSAGLYHWTICLIKSSEPKIRKGELSAFLAYLAEAHPAIYQKVWQRFGIGIAGQWGTDGKSFTDEPPGHSREHKNVRKYFGWITLQEENGQFTMAPRERTFADHLRGWHWFYRLQMAIRTNPEIPQLMWNYARMRIRDIRATPWDGTTTVALEDGTTRIATIGDYFTSEKAITMITRWHVWYPDQMISGGKRGSKLQAALNNANLSGNPLDWTTTQETTLIDKLKDAAQGSLMESPMTTIQATTDLSGDRNSFKFDTSNLPDSPFA